MTKAAKYALGGLLLTAVGGLVAFLAWPSSQGGGSVLLTLVAVAAAMAGLFLLVLSFLGL